MDIEVTNHGSIFLLTPLTPAGEEWMNDHLPEDAPMLGNAVAVEPRYVEDIVNGAQHDGLVVA